MDKEPFLQQVSELSGFRAELEFMEWIHRTDQFDEFLLYLIELVLQEPVPLRLIIRPLYCKALYVVLVDPCEQGLDCVGSVHMPFYCKSSIENSQCKQKDSEYSYKSS